MHVLLTGATGFLGEAWLAALPAGTDVTVLGRTPPPHRTVNFIECELGRPGAVAEARVAGRLPETIDAVVHLAVSRHHRHFPRSALDMFEVNVAVAAHLLDYARSARASRFLCGSTGSVYDSSFGGELREDAALAPQRYFPASKHASELLSAAYRDIFPVSVLRFFGPYGPGQADRLAPDLINRVSTGDAVTLPPTWVDDAIRVINQALTQSWNTTVNVAAPEVWTVAAAAEEIGRALGRRPVFDRQSGAPDYCFTPSLDRLGERMDTKEFVCFGEGIRRILAANADG